MYPENAKHYNECRPQIVSHCDLIYAEQPCDLALCHPDIAIDQSDCNRTKPVVVLGYLNRTEIFYLFFIVSSFYRVMLSGTFQQSSGSGYLCHDRSCRW